MTHTFHPSILRAYDIRGVIGETLSQRDAYFIGRAFATRVKQEEGRVVCVGRDGRLSSPELMQSVIQGLSEGGLDVICVGLGPTPLTYFAMHHLKADAALMVTGSHNPANYNGFKMCLSKGPMFGRDIEELGQIAEAGDLSEGSGKTTDRDLAAIYLEYLLKDFSTHYPNAKSLKIAWDAGNGAAGELLEDLAKELPGEHILLNTTIDGTFPAHHPDPVVLENLVQLQQAVAEGGCDLGIAFDGDGDRIGVIDGQGRMIFGDLLVTLFAGEVLKTHPSAPIIVDVKASQVFFEEVKRLGGEPIMWRTGHSIIKSKMKQIDCPLAGEMSGHMFFADRYFGFDDALYAAMRLIGIVSSQEETIAQWRDRLPQRISTPEMNIACDDVKKFQIIEEITEKLKAQPDIALNDIDGVRVTTKAGWWLLRASNTQSALVARIEADTQENVEKLRQELAAHLAAYGLKAT
ncbi:MAG: phosphomannomutase/phosphoglucomutase [Pseudomonadota bacterium]